MKKRISNFIPKVGQIYMIDLQIIGKYCLHGLHPCVIYNMVGSNYNVVPISENKGNLHWCEYPIELGRCGMYKNSKLKLDQMRPISKEKIKYQIGTADNDIIDAISNYLILQASNLKKQVA